MSVRSRSRDPLRAAAALAAGRAAGSLSQALGRGSGTMIGGRLALRLDPGVLATVALAFAEHGVSIQTVRQEGRDDDAQLVVVSHWATDAQLSATVEHLRGLDIVREVTSVMRVEGGDE